MALQTKQVLITVKAYPNPSKKYGETVCCAGIDLDTRSWIRLYPIQFRDLEFPKRFRKYDIVQVRCEKAVRDRRIESYRVDQDSITVLGHLDTKHQWRARREILLPTASSSFCAIEAMVARDVSLGMFKPCEIEFSWQEAEVGDKAQREACYAQLSFFDKQKKAIEKVPFDFYYHFHCAGNDDCSGHRLKIVDWEMGQLYRRLRDEHMRERLLLEKMQERWLHRMCADSNDVYFYVGNMQRFRDQFLILGVFFPKK
ncbi:MAG: hypothetical protein JW741_29400 [Sedimentisphaerales bacterium]|nr:hypothetical protein [Sedimentisphaerales bacterium]